jgi:aryl-alcohol dehydrogenase-like predicted oxidoreductase
MPMMPSVPFGRTGRRVSRLGFGAWAIGGSWGATDDSTSLAALERARDLGVTFIDTADVYGDGRSETLVARVRRPEVFVATKAGRRLPRQIVEGYSRDNLVSWVDRSRRLLGVEALDLLQLHCPPTDLYRSDRVFRVLDDLVRDGRIRHYGVSVERIDEALLALQYPGVQSIQIVFNLFRQRPADELFGAASARDVAIIARVPLASGLLSGRIGVDTRFPADDHRTFNRSGEAFDVGETFSGLPLDAAMRAVEALRLLVPPGATLAQLALRWILMYDAVTVAIPGCRTPAQAGENLAAAALPPLTPATMSACREIYDRCIRRHVHHRW